MKIYPVTGNRWDDLVQFFKAHGNPNYCWCMTWRNSGSEFEIAAARNAKKR